MRAVPRPRVGKKPAEKLADIIRLGVDRELARREALQGCAPSSQAED
jgi:hypothetical protein